MDAVPLIRLMSLVIVTGGMNYVLGVVGLINLNQAKYFTYSILVAGAAAILTLLPIASIYGVFAGAFTMLEAEVILLACITGSLLYIKHHHIG